MDPALEALGGTSAPGARVRVLVQTADVPAVERLIRGMGGRTGRRLPAGRAVVAHVAAGDVAVLSGSDAVEAVSLDRPLRGTLDHTAAAIGARWVTEHLGFDGTGVGVAIIDSGVTGAHDDLGGNQVVHFADFVDFAPAPRDGYGHGTHVAGCNFSSIVDAQFSPLGQLPSNECATFFYLVNMHFSLLASLSQLPCM
jgi:subtilisin family serine protease